MINREQIRATLAAKGVAFTDGYDSEVILLDAVEAVIEAVMSKTHMREADLVQSLAAAVAPIIADHVTDKAERFEITFHASKMQDGAIGLANLSVQKGDPRIAVPAHLANRAARRAR